MLRVVMIPVVLVLLVEGSAKMNFWAAIVYSLAAVTDALDGWLARRQGLVSVLGKFLDPLADKLLIMAALVFMVHMGRVEAWVATIIIARELSITSLRTIAISEGVVIAASQGGKEKTAVQMVAILLLIIHYPYTLHFGFVDLPVNLAYAGRILLYASVFFAVTSAGEYVKLFVDAVDAKEARMKNVSERPPE